MARRIRHWQQRCESQKIRLEESTGWFPYPFLIPVALCVILLVKAMVGINPRLGNPADVLTFEGEPATDASIWFSVTPIGRDIVVTTAERLVFRWPQQLKDDTQLREFTNYLKEKVVQEAEATALGKKATTYQTTAVIAADQRLKYLHLKPILYALADARIRSYAFESKTLEQAATDKPEHTGESGAHNQ